MTKRSEGVLEFKPDPGKYISFGFAAGLGAVISSTLVIKQNLFVGLAFAVLCTFGALVLCAAPFSERLVLRLTSEGVKYGTFKRTHFFPWSAFDRFDVVDLGGKRTCFRLKPEARIGDKVAAINRSSIGCDRFLPATYGKSAKELAELLESWRDRYSRNKETDEGRPN